MTASPRAHPARGSAPCRRPGFLALVLVALLACLTAPAPADGDAPQTAFDRSSFPVPGPTSMVWAPDGRLYVTEIFGTIHRITFGPDMQVASDELITTLGTRLTLGITVDPGSTADNVGLWVSHSSPSLDDGTPNSSTITRLSGAGFATSEDVITGLPRAKANHAVNSIHFGPDGRLYIAAGGNTGAGAPNTADTEFGTMAEQPLSAALLVADVSDPSFDGSCANSADIFGPPPCDVAPYATGLRNMYDFVFHSNGSIYGPDNGLGVTGSFPPSPTPPCTGNGSTESWESGGHNPGDQPDELNLIREGRYYGHPNPYRDECVFGDGHWQSVAAPANYTAPILDLGSHRSANGTIEYRADAFCGDLERDLLLANYASGDDITVVELSADGQSVAQSSTLIAGFSNPLPLAQSPTGHIFVGELAADVVTVLTPQVLGCWEPRTDAPVALLDAGGAALAGEVYLVGGKTSTGHRSEVHVYDPVGDDWRSAPNLPGPAVENPAVVAHAGKLYAFGGSTGPFSGAVTNAAVYDGSTWTALPPMPVARGGATAQVVDGKIYVLGGMGGDGASLASVDVFDPGAGSWSSGPPMGTRRDNPGSAGIDSELYVFGGRTRNADGTTIDGTLETVEMLDPTTGTWVDRAPMPTGRRAMAVGRLEGRVQLIGGEAASDGGPFAENEEYDPASDTWRTLRRMPTGRHGAAAGTIDGVVYVIGGGPTAGSSWTAANEGFWFSPPDPGDPGDTPGEDPGGGDGGGDGGDSPTDPAAPEPGEPGPSGDGGDPDGEFAADETGPILKVELRKRRLRKALRKGLRLKASCSEVCTVKGKLKLRRKTARKLGLKRVVARGRKKLLADETAGVRMRFGERAARKLRRRKRVRLTLEAIALDAERNRSRLVRIRVVLRR